MKPLEIFRTGRHTATNGTTLDWSAAHLSAIAAAYDPKVSEAPIVVGHPTTNAPAYGWVEKLTVEGDKLLAHAAQVDAGFAAIVNEGRFKKISPSFLPPGHRSNPKPAGFYLRHVGFLGAQAPAVQGLKPAEFAGDEAGILSFGDDAPLDYADLQRRNAELEAELKRRSAITSEALIDGLVKQGRVLPVERNGMLAFMAAIEDGGQLSFAEANVTISVSLVEFMTKFLKSLPPRVPLGEFAAARGDGLDFTEGEEPRAIADEIEAFAKSEAAAGRRVDPASAASHVANRRRKR